VQYPDKHYFLGTTSVLRYRAETVKVESICGRPANEYPNCDRRVPYYDEKEIEELLPSITAALRTHSFQANSKTAVALLPIVYVTTLTRVVL
jgi:hypothetical protein